MKTYYFKNYKIAIGFCADKPRNKGEIHFTFSDDYDNHFEFEISDLLRSLSVTLKLVTGDMYDALLTIENTECTLKYKVKLGSTDVDTAKELIHFCKRELCMEDVTIC